MEIYTTKKFNFYIKFSNNVSFDDIDDNDKR